MRAHEALVGPIPDGFQIDHTCHDPDTCPPGPCGHRRCVNPGHLEAVTPKTNTLRSGSLTAEQVRRTHCPQGHEYTEENTSVSRGQRECRECRRVKNRTAYHANRDKRRAYYREWRARQKALAQPA